VQFFFANKITEQRQVIVLLNLLRFINIDSSFAHKNICIMNNIGIRIKKLREERGIKQESIAQQLNLTQMPMVDWKKTTVG
jgi:DNA-binding transcriptional regulator YiaG